MAKYAILHTCGHEVTHQIYGKNRDWQISRLEGEQCWDCEKAERAAAAAAATDEAGLVALGGSEKQVAWANQIRLELLAKVDRRIAAINATFEERKVKFPADKVAEAAKKLAVMNEAGERIRSKESAKWWIENRDRHVDAVINQEIKNIK